MFSFKGKVALITGASSGIGKAFAQELASVGMNLVLVARSKNKLEKLKEELTKKYSIQVDAIPIDLTHEKAPLTLYNETQKRELSIDLLINNAGFGSYGEFETLSLERETNQIKLNVLALVRLTHLFLPQMQSRGEGAVVHVASTSAFQPTPYMAVYGATKAFVLSFSEALWAENQKKGVRILALCPGPTQTDFFHVVGAEEPAVAKKLLPNMVVKKALKALEKGKPYVIPSFSVYILAQLPRLVSRSMTARISKKVLQPQHNETEIN
jgi:uncharacterized protein